MPRSTSWHLQYVSNINFLTVRNSQNVFCNVAMPARVLTARKSQSGQLGEIRAIFRQLGEGGAIFKQLSEGRAIFRQLGEARAIFKQLSEGEAIFRQFGEVGAIFN